MYTIKVTYRTGDSFNTYTEENEINLSWENISLAKQCLINIKEHYDIYRKDSEARNENDTNACYKDVLSKDWCRDKKIRKSDIFYSSLHAECDDGEWRRVSAGMWIGYFETLESAEVVGIDKDMKIEFLGVSSL